jgi:hypothetical protein
MTVEYTFHVEDLSPLDQAKFTYRQDCYERVYRGVEYLDRVLPGWESFLDLGSFQIASPMSCVLGQLARKDMADFNDQLQAYIGEQSYRQRDYFAALEVLPEVQDHPRSDNDWAHEHGFNNNNSPYVGEFVEETLHECNCPHCEVEYDEDVGGDLFGGDDHWAILQECWMDVIISRFDRKAPHGAEVYAPAVLEVIEEIKADGPRNVTITAEDERSCDECGYRECECCGECEQGPDFCDCFTCAECDGTYRDYNYNCDEETDEALCDDCFSDRQKQREDAADDAAVEVE